MSYRVINLTTKFLCPFTFKSRKSAMEFLEPFRYGIDYFIIVKDNKKHTGGSL